jgi:glycosyltransferase involved in cell wall biosynthesis
MSTKPLRHISVNTRLLLGKNLEGIGRFSVEILRRMVLAHPNVEFSFLFDRPFDPKFIFADNVTPHVLFPPARHAFLFVAFFEYAMPHKLSRLKPDIHFSPDGYLSLRSQVPQVPVFHDLAFEHFPQDVSRLFSWHYRRYFPRYAQKAQKIITVSEFTKQDVVSHYGVDGNKIEVVHNACASFFGAADEHRKILTRHRFASDKRYFHTVGAIQPRKNLARLIEAFDQFKTHSGSDWKLLIVGRKAWNFDEVIHSYAQSPHKDDIVFTGFLSDEELNEVYGASEGLVYVPLFEGFGIPIIEAMQCEVPVICSNTSSMPEVAGDAAILVNPHSMEEIANAMHSLHRNDELASTLIDKGRQQRQRFSWDVSADRVWNVLSEC